MKLFHDHDRSKKLTFEKIAMPVRLSESPDNWQREIAGEVYKQLPYLGDYAVNVLLDRVEPQRGFAMGSIEVSNKSQAPEQDQEKLPRVRIPVIVKDRLMAPLDVFMDGSGVLPLTESRLREKLFRTDTFELSERKPTDKSLMDQLYPPFRTNHGMGASGSDAMGKYAFDAEAGRRAAIARMKAEAAANSYDFTGGGGKEAAVGGSIIEDIASTISEKQAQAFLDKITKDEALTLQASRNESFQKLAFKILGAPRFSVTKTAEAMRESIVPTVVQFTKLASGNFNVKWANAGAFAPQQMQVPPQDANAMAGQDMSKMQPGQAATFGAEKAQATSLIGGMTRVKDPGLYKAMAADSNQEIVGHVLPIIDFEMQPLELLLFVSPKGYSVQEDIAGTRLPDQGAPATGPIHQAQGDGALVFASPDNPSAFRALSPLTVQNTAQTPDGSFELHATDQFGQQLVLTITPGLQAVQKMGEGQYAVPAEAQWLPLNNLMMLASTDESDAVGAAQKAPSTVEVGSTGPGEFHMDGPPLAKVANQQKSFLKTAEAVFLLVSMGLEPGVAEGVLKVAEKRHDLVKIAGLRPIVPLASLRAQMTKQAMPEIANFPYHLRKDLVKEASVLDDADTADKVLAMNFINPENVNTFAKYLPDFDQTSMKLAEMLVAARLGLKPIDEGAVERSMHGLEEVIEGLKMLRQKQTA
jgi:hypothetical protein